VVRSQRIALLASVKAYAQPNIRYGDPICVAGARTDRDQAEWVRLFPVPFGDLDPSQQFKKYQLIAVEARKPRNDRRPESWRPDCGTLELGRFVDSRGRWADRRRFLQPLIVESMCALQRDQRKNGTSLALFKPAAIEDFDWKRPHRKSQPGALPFRFRYHYRCFDSRCKGHSQVIVDWELAESFREWKVRFGSERVVLESLRRKWLDEMCGPEQDTHFFAGNMADRPSSFLILGVFWPRRS
jgi:hypothetical protein